MNKKINLKNIFLIFLILQPFFDSYYLYTDKIINFFGFSPTTIIRLVVIGFYCILLFFKKKKSRKFVVTYLIIILIYILFHHLVGASINDELIYQSFKYSLIDEIFYFLRMLLPIGVIYITYQYKYTKDDLKVVIKYSAIILSLIIILMNVFGIALTSYGSTTIRGTIFDIFNPDIERKFLASKGWFNSANQISAVVLMFIVMMEYYVLTEKKVSDIIVSLILLIASMMLGTRVATIGVLAVIIAMLLAFIFIQIINNQRNKKNIVILILSIVGAFLIFNIAPIVNCKGYNFQCLFKIDNSLNSEDIIETPKGLKYEGNTCEFIRTTPANPEYYNKLYPCEHNVEFWDKFSKDKAYSYANNRTMQVLVTQDIYSKIGNIGTDLFGISRSRFLNAKIYLEKDVYVHLYTIGILGVILLLIIPYIIPCIIMVIRNIKNKKIEYYDCCLCGTVFLIFLVSYLSGHILDELIITQYLGLIVGIIINCNSIKKNKKRIKRTLIVNDEKMTGGVSTLLEDILNNIDHNIEIDLLILHNHGTRLENLPSNVHVMYGGKFFEIVDLNIRQVLKTKNLRLIINKTLMVTLMKLHLIEPLIKYQRHKLLKNDYEQEIAFKDGFCGLFVLAGNASRKVQWLHSDYSRQDYLEKYRSLFLKEFNKMDTFVAVSKNVADNFNNIYKQSKKTIVIHNLIDTKKIINKANEEDIELSNKLNMISVGRFHKDKGFDRILEIIKRLKNENNKIAFKFYLIGYGDEYDNLNKMVVENDLSEYVELLGKKENPYPYIKSADLFIMSSLHESFGIVIVEALSLGVPVISTKLATINEILTEENGLIVDNSLDGLYNGIKEILNNQNRLKVWKNNLKNYHYDNDKIIKELEELLLIKE